MKLLFAGLLLAVLATACSGGGSNPSATATEMPAATGTTTTDVTTTPSQTSTIPTYPRETRTGLDAVDQVLVSVLAADANDVLRRLQYIQVPCAGPDRPIPGPGCPDRVPVGTMVLAFPLTGCSSGLEAKDSIGPVVKGFAVAGLQLFAVFRVDAARAAASVAPGDFGLVFVDPSRKEGVAMFVVAADSQGGIVHWANSCGVTDPQEFTGRLPIASYILPPR